jgi:hypothetical protein
MAEKKNTQTLRASSGQMITDEAREFRFGKFGMGREENRGTFLDVKCFQSDPLCTED